MNKLLRITLSLLLMITLISQATAFAELTENPKQFISKLAEKARHSIRSIQTFSILSVVRGTVTLLAPPRLSALRDSLRSIYAGNNFSPRRIKKIPVRGINNGSTIFLEGKGRVGMGYEFSIPTPESINMYARRNTFTDFDIGSIQISHTNSISVSAFLDIDRVKGDRIKNAGALRGNFSTPVRGGKAKGRFALKLSTR